jgi:hypothetical protein
MGPSPHKAFPVFSLPTVFIVGAGANAEFGMPTGGLPNSWTGGVTSYYNP